MPSPSGRAHGRRPLAPVLAVLLGQHAVGREVGERLAAPPAEPVEAGLAVEAGEDRLQRLHLQLEDRVAVDPARAVQRAPGVAEPLARRPRRPLPARAPPRRAGRAGWRTGGSTGSRATARSGGTGVGAVIGFTITTPPPRSLREAPDARQVGEVADPPARPRARGVDLRREAPGAQIVGQEAVARADDQRLLPSPPPSPARVKAVVAERQVPGQLAVDGVVGAVLQHQVGAPARAAGRRPAPARARRAPPSSSGAVRVRVGAPSPP